MKTLFIEPGLFAIRTQVIDTEAHQHALIQLTILERAGTLSITSEQNTVVESNSITLIQADIVHQLQMEQGWIVLIEPSSQIGLQAQEKLASHEFRTWPLTTPHESLNTLQSILAQAQLTYPPNTNSHHTHLDTRIARLLEQLDQCFTQDCLKPEHWQAQEVASIVNLSQSRFLHLFKENMKLPWRPYLLWRRLICAIQALSQGQSATQAAYIAGFADSAHLSRTFKKQFGITLRHALKGIQR